MQTRRHFIAATSLATVGSVVGARLLPALTPRRLARSAAALMPHATPLEALSALAEYTINEADRFGVQFADLRLGEVQQFGIRLSVYRTEPSLWITVTRHYGVRVMVNGVWGYAAGVTLSRAHLAQAVAKAVTHAKHHAAAYLQGTHPSGAFAAAPAVRGEWIAPVDIDPFDIPLREHQEQLGALNVNIDRVIGISPYTSGTAYNWSRESMVFASTEGSLIVQQAMRARPMVQLWPDESQDWMTMPSYGCATGGFETAIDPLLMERIKAHADTVVALHRLPEVAADVGRYTVVMEGCVAAKHVHRLAQACEADRALGGEADASGTTFLSPIEKVLGPDQGSFAPEVNLGVEASGKKSTSWKWDCEGVSCESYPLITNGRVKGFTTSREFIGPEGYREATRLRGGSLVGSCDQLPMVGAGEVKLTPRPHADTVDDLLKDVQKGLYLTDSVRVNADPTLSTSSSEAKYMFKIEKGKLVGRVLKMGLLHRTQKMWKDGLLHIGGTSTEQFTECDSFKGMPWQHYRQIVTSPALILGEVDAVRIGSGVGSLL